MTNQDTDTNINEINSSIDHREHRIMSGDLRGQPGYCAWLPGKPGTVTVADSRWEAIYQLSLYLSGVEDRT